ncbi:hypothetical protein [Pontiella agarivorans]|uniref:PEP-CTERM sorting domain-containing protein n=1 Tax=Pontiella agarivorans TaxID=3038953 RepID=A0ABU5MZS6_9BACT|nr:hypothetical protein [Pontiella agarivorans]MDZ8119683.1 hypothetical protein [Pontiella agarivorans]
MEETAIPYCEPPPSDVIPMLVVALVFLGGTIVYRWFRNRRASGPRK